MEIAEMQDDNFNFTELIPTIKNRLETFTKSLSVTNNNNTESISIANPVNLSEDYVKEYSSRSEYIQYARAYFTRLVDVKQGLMAKASTEWRNIKICENILDLKGKEPGVIFGVVYKEMPLKPSILKGMESILGAKKVESFVSSSEDFLVLEDFSGRVRVSKNSEISSGEFVSGVIVAAKGRLDDRGLFLIEEITFPIADYHPLPPRIKTNLSKNLKSNSAFEFISSDSPIIGLISGLQFGKVDYSGRLAYSRNLFLDLIQNRMTSDSNLSRLFKRLNRLVIAGNSVNAPDEVDLVEKGSYLKAELNSRVYKTMIQNYDDWDDYLNILSHSVAVDVMPGGDDNSSSYFPALPINPIVLAQSGTNSTVNLVTNPYKFTLEDVLFLGTSGQNVDNIRKYSTLGPESTKIMNRTLEWAHICPCAPDTLRTFPVVHSDPLSLATVPNVYFAANQTKFESEISYYKENPVRVIAVPDFSVTFSFVLLDMNTLDVCEYLIDLNN